MLATLVLWGASAPRRSEGADPDPRRERFAEANRLAIAGLRGRRIEWATIGWTRSSGEVALASTGTYWTDGNRVYLSTRRSADLSGLPEHAGAAALDDEVWTTVKARSEFARPEIRRFDGVRLTYFHEVTATRFEGMSVRKVDAAMLAPSFATGLLLYYEFPIHEIMRNWSPGPDLGEGSEEEMSVATGEHVVLLRTDGRTPGACIAMIHLRGRAGLVDGSAALLGLRSVPDSTPGLQWGSRMVAAGTGAGLQGIEMEVTIPHVNRWEHRRILRDVPDDGASFAWDGIPAEYEGQNGVLVDEVTRETRNVEGVKADGLRLAQNPAPAVGGGRSRQPDAIDGSSTSWRIVLAAVGVAILLFGVASRRRNRRRNSG